MEKLLQKIVDAVRVLSADTVEEAEDSVMAAGSEVEITYKLKNF